MESKLAVRAYVERLLCRKKHKVAKAQAILNLALKYWYRDSKLWTLLAKSYTLQSSNLSDSTDSDDREFLLEKAALAESKSIKYGA